MQIEITILIAVVGCLIGVAGFTAGRDKRIAKDSEWRGAINEKLELLPRIQGEIASMRADIDASMEASRRESAAVIDVIRKEIDDIDKRVTVVEEFAKSAHHRLNGLDRRKG